MQQSLITARWSTRPAFTVCRTSSSRQRPGLCCLKGRRSLRGFYRRATTGAPRTLDDQLAVPDLTRRRIDHSRVMVAFPIPMPAILPTGGSAMPANDSCQQACDPRGRLGHHQADDRPPRTPICLHQESQFFRSSRVPRAENLTAPAPQKHRHIDVFVAWAIASRSMALIREIDRPHRGAIHLQFEDIGSSVMPARIELPA